MGPQRYPVFFFFGQENDVGWDDECCRGGGGLIQNHFTASEYKVNVESTRRKIEGLMLRIFNLGFGYQKKIKIVTKDTSYYWEL